MWITIEAGNTSVKKIRSGSCIKFAVTSNLNDSIIMERALTFAKEFGCDSKFLASTGWLKNFKKRNKLQSYKKRGEIGSVNMEDIGLTCRIFSKNMIIEIYSTVTNCQYFLYTSMSHHVH